MNWPASHLANKKELHWAIEKERIFKDGKGAVKGNN